MMAENGGCMSKVPGLELFELIDNTRSKMRFSPDAFLNSIVNGQIEDAAILPITTGDSIADSDFGPLVGTDLKTAGMVAVLNAISDIYAMGEPLNMR